MQETLHKEVTEGMHPLDQPVTLRDCSPTAAGTEPSTKIQMSRKPSLPRSPREREALPYP